MIHIFGKYSSIAITRNGLDSTNDYILAVAMLVSSAFWITRQYLYDFEVLCYDFLISIPRKRKLSTALQVTIKWTQCFTITCEDWENKFLCSQLIKSPSLLPKIHSSDKASGNWGRSWNLNEIRKSMYELKIKEVWAELCTPFRNNIAITTVVWRPATPLSRQWTGQYVRDLRSIASVRWFRIFLQTDKS